MKESRQRALVFPREHGAWGMLLVPLATGAATGLLAGGEFLPLVPLIVAALALFWLRTPVESWLGTTPMRAHTGAELRLVRRTALTLAALAVLALAEVFRSGRSGPLARIGAGAALAFLAQAFLKKVGRRARIAAQTIGAAGLCSAAPAAYVVAAGHWSATAAALWIANWLFAANQIHFVQLRIRGARAANRTEKLALGRGFLAGQAALIALLAAACGAGWFAWPAPLAFLPALIRGFGWFAAGPQPLAIRRLGWTELAHAAAFGILLVWGLPAM